MQITPGVTDNHPWSKAYLAPPRAKIIQNILRHLR